MNKKFMTIMLSSILMFTVFTGCGNNTDNTVKSQMDNASNDVKNGVENIGDDVKNGAEDLGNDVRNGANDLANDIDGNAKGSKDNVLNKDYSLIPYQFDYSGNYRQYTNNNSGYYSSSESYKNKQEGTAVYDSVKKISGIEDVKIAIIGEKAYCAVKTKTSANSLSSEKKARINNLIKAKYPQVKNVYFSDKVKGYTSLANSIENGLRNVTDDVLHLFGL